MANFNDYDLQTQEEDLARRKAVIDALTMRYSNTNGERLRQAFGAAPTGSAEMEAYARDNSAFQQRKQQQMQQELAQYMDRMQGAPERPAQGDGVGPPVPAQPANPREAIIRAMTSQLPEMQAMGKSSMAAFGKVPEVKEHVINNQLVRSRGTGPVEVAGSYDNWKDEDKVINGQATAGKRNVQSGDWKPLAPAGQTINIGDKGNGKLMEEVIPVVKASRDSVLQAQTGLEASQRVLQALQDPAVQTGWAAGGVTGLASIGAKLGFNGADSVAKTQSLMADLARNTVTAMQQQKGTQTKEDMILLENATLGKIDYTKDAIQDIAALAYQANHNATLNAMDQYKSCLLYTSPSPRDGATSRMPSSA